MNVNNQNTK